MAKFVAKSMTLTLGGNAITCMQSVDTSEEVDTYVEECSGAASKKTHVGLKMSTMTVNLLIDADGVTVANYIAPGSTGAVVFQPNGTNTGDIEITSTKGTVTRREMGASVNGLTAMTAEIALDDLTVAAQS